uniref:Retrotransposon gag domain-containing protein n=1 Tax=Lactuca sativa TaxID=4236 RepID=A0A9R1UJZ2_LACSA|nr:hypothetical protein LSAT_V11C900490710 [Lactuca sativa]
MTPTHQTTTLNFISTCPTPRQMQVNNELSDKNDTYGAQEMENFLLAKNNIGFVAWMRCDVMVKSWLTTTMEKEIRTSFKYANTTLKIWSDLRERFEMESATRAYELKNQLIDIHQDGKATSQTPGKRNFL